jgi:hypothetical protein
MATTHDMAGRVRLTVELDRDTEPPSGWVQVEHGEQREFTSLLELISLLESARAGPPVSG